MIMIIYDDIYSLTLYDHWIESIYENKYLKLLHKETKTVRITFQNIYNCYYTSLREKWYNGLKE